MKHFWENLTPEEEERIVEEARQYFQQKKDYENRQIDRIKKFIDKLSDEELAEWVERFLYWEECYEDHYYYDKQTLTYSNIFHALTDVVEKEGKSIRSYGPFESGSYKWNDFRFELHCGQGCFWRIKRNGKTIFQTT